MMIDCLRLPEGATIEASYCVIGAGAAGIAVANELREAGEDVVLLESGGQKTSRSTQDLCKGEVLDPARHGDLAKYRRRRFGGTTDVWGGRCAPFEPIDFQMREHVPWSGWPIRRADLDPYYARAHDYCDLGAYEYSASAALTAFGPASVHFMRQQGVDTDFIWRFSLPTDFGERYRGAFVASEHVRVYLHATALQFRMAPNREAVDRLEIAALPGKKFVVKARHYIMATGGLEAARLLMLSKDAGSEGLGNSRGLVGRFYISHITGDLGSAVFSPEFATAMASYEQTRDGVYCRRALSISEETQRKERLLNIRVILSHPSPADPAHGSGVLSAMYLVKSHFSDRIPPEYSKALSGMSTYEELSAHCRNIVRDWRNVAGFGNLWIRRRILSKRKLPSVVHRSRSNVYTLHFDAEQAPNPESRVTLSESKDEYGLNRLKVDWRCTAQDIESVVKCAAFISHALESSGVGKCLFDAQKLGPVIAANTGVGSHHVGLTRMADSPSAGVVDSNCKVHGIDNLFVASSATFPTASFANPTLTIVALAIRLADHLKTRTARPVEVLADAS